MSDFQDNLCFGNAVQQEEARHSNFSVAGMFIGAAAALALTALPSQAAGNVRLPPIDNGT